MAHKMGAGSTQNSRDSQSKRLGLKCGNFEKVEAGSIIIRQRGTCLKAGQNVACGKDYTLYALKRGIINFTKAGIVHVIENLD
jgi:large subunit ribosomal protein L27